MQLNMSEKQFRRLLDLVYTGNWVMNSLRGNDRIEEFDEVESLVFKACKEHGMSQLAAEENGVSFPSNAFAEGGIHEAIAAYEDTVFYEILAEEFARRDMQDEGLSTEGNEFKKRMGEYIKEFERHGTDNIKMDL